MINLLDNTPTQPSKFKRKNCVEINDDSQGAYSTSSQIRFKTSMLKFQFVVTICDYPVAYILFIGAISVANVANQGASADNNNK